MSSWKQTVSGTAGVLVVLGILIAANVIMNQIRAFRMDLTKENLYTLSDGTKSMLRDLDRDVTLLYYFSRSAESTPIQLKQYAQRIQDLLREYQTHSGGRVALEVHDPKPDSDQEEWARKHGIVSQGLSMLGGDEIYLGLAAVSGPREAAIPFIDPGAEPRLEYLVTRLVHEVTIQERPKVGIVSSLPVMGTPSMPFMQPQQEAPRKWYFVSELERVYDVVEVSPDATSLPEDLTMLVVAHVKEPSEALLYAIDQFVLGGGRLMAFVDPLCMADDTAQPQFQQFGPPQSASDLNRLTEAWGLRMDSASVVADTAAATQLNIGGGRIDRVPTWLSLRGDTIDREEVATSSLEFVMMPFPGALTGDAVGGLTLTPLLTTSEDAGTVNSFQALAGSASVLQSMQPKGTLPLAVRLQGTFPTAFPDGRPDTETDQEDADVEELADADADAEDATHLATGTAPGVVILVADADMLADQNCVRTFNMLGQILAEPLNDNLNLVLNFAEQLTGSEALIGLRSRGTFQRPFDRVIALQKSAQEKWQAEEQGLQAKMQETQARINELQRGKQQDQELILSPEQQQEIDRFNQELANTRQQLKDVRKNLRRDIEILGMKVKVINIAAVPLVVAGWGIARGVRRKKLAARPV
jgi:ABC-type uncharacterized transport system involved in gliding motility auxiliary subunit